ncbi:MAG: sulfotransferase family protein [Pseudomonadota bacterium]
MANPPARKMILVAGMHRSGTSALTRVLSLLGCDLPAHLIPPQPTNPRGLWESEIVTALDDEILESCGTRWDDWRAIERGWFGSESAGRFRARAVDILAAEYGAFSLGLLKDPRICRLLPFWLDAVRARGAEPAIVLPLRHPLEVCRSLARRDGLDSSQARVMWLRYTLDAELHSRALPRVFTTYEGLLEDWRSVADSIASRLALAWPRSGDDARADIEAFLSPRLRHQRVSERALTEDAERGGWIEEAYRALLRLVGDPADAQATAALDGVRERFDAAARLFGPACALRPSPARGLSLWRRAADKLAGFLLRRPRTGLRARPRRG